MSFWYARGCHDDGARVADTTRDAADDAEGNDQAVEGAEDQFANATQPLDSGALSEEQ